MLRPISLRVDHVKSPRFRLIDAAKLEGVIDGMGKVSEPGLQETVQVEKLQHWGGACFLAPEKIGRYDGRRPGLWGNLDRY